MATRKQTLSRIVWLPLVMLIVIAQTAHTQDSTPSLNVERVREVLTTARRDIFEAGMGLSTEQENDFWTIFDQYEKERAPVTQKTIEIVADYARNYSTLTDDRLMKLLKDSGANQKKGIDLRTKYAQQIGKKLGTRVGARFYQIDDYITTATRADVLDAIPFVGGSR
jgi:hypothetical protein